MTLNKTVSNKYSSAFLIISAGFITCLLSANMASVKIVSFGGLYMDAGTIVFPISYIFGDILTEVYGYRQSRFIIWLGFLANIFLVAVLMVTSVLPAAPFWNGQEAYEKIIGFTPRLLLASVCAYLCGEFVNSAIVSRLKLLCNGKKMWVRIVSSTFFGQFFDSCIFGIIAFSGVIPVRDLYEYILIQWLFKSGYEFVISPLTCKFICWLKNYEQCDTYDYGVSLNPFRVK